MQHEAVPVLTQYASPELIEAIVYRGADPAQDPAWAASGAIDREEYGRWAGHCCGMACLRMALLHRDGWAPSMLELLRAGLPHGTYRADADGRLRGLYYDALATWVLGDFGLPVTVHRQLDIAGIHRELAVGGRMVIISVHREIRRPDRGAPGRGGHLVLVTGTDPAAGTITFHNPSGHTDAARVARLSEGELEPFFAHRGMTLHLTTG